MRISPRLLLVLALLPGVPSLAEAQGYFGQNQVHYGAFDFKIIQTEHFDVYYYDQERAAALDAARMAERSYARLSRILDHRFTERKPIILYASHSDFQQNNAVGYAEGVEGATDPLKQRNVLPFPGSYREFEHVLTHEMVHQFQFDTWSHGHAGANIGALISLNPPGWFVEGMAEYLSLGPKDAATAMWLRDAALEGQLPTIDQLTYDPRIFPYRYGHALLAYIGERWGDEAIGAILKGSGSGSLENAFRRVTGEKFTQLTTDWHDAIQKRFLPEIGNREKARAFATVMLNQEKVDGRYHLAPALSPDGRQVAFFSERNTFFVDLWLADATTGKVVRRLFKSTWSSNYETFRFIYSSVAWSPDGKYLAFVAKSGPRDDIIVLDVDRNKEVSRIEIPLSAALTPSWSPDGKQIVFSGLDGGLSDLFIVNADGTGFKRLTNDKYADLSPVWSPDGKSIAFVTDRGPETDFRTLVIGNYRLALYHLEDGTIELLPHMDRGRNTSPQWSPDGKQLAFLSDRSGVSDIFLYDLGDRQIYRLTDLYTGAGGITSTSPALSWAPQADRLAFVYYEKGNFDVYGLLNPRSLRQQPWTDTPDEDAMASLTLTRPSALAAAPDSAAAAVDTGASRARTVVDGGSIYRSSTGFRAADRAPVRDSTVPAPISVAALLDSAQMALPDTAEFTMKRYHVKFSPDYISQPTVGYTRNNFGRGFYGGTTIVLSDILGGNALVFSGYINGSLAEANILAAYQNTAHRMNYAVGASTAPYFLIGQSSQPAPDTVVTTVDRFIIRQAFGQASYPFNRFSRVEGQLALTNVQEDFLRIADQFDSFGLTGNEDQTTIHVGTSYFAQPSLALVFDNSIPGYVGPYIGRRSRFEISQTLGDWHITQLTADYRRYDHLFGPFVFATRGLVIDRTGRDAGRQLQFIGYPDYVRGYTSGSFYSNECPTASGGGYTGCKGLDNLLGTSFAVGSAELRFPLLNAELGFLPIGFPPIEGAVFYDVGAAWGSPDPSLNPTPIANGNLISSWGTSIRVNVLGFVVLRFDYAFPQQRAVKGYWTVSLGPTF
ncbi:MAG: BamA/TamA family outer membrane protein [Gemmatimonadales bacterium]